MTDLKLPTDKTPASDVVQNIVKKSVQGMFQENCCKELVKIASWVKSLCSLFTDIRLVSVTNAFLAHNNTVIHGKCIFCSWKYLQNDLLKIAYHITVVMFNLNDT